MQAPNNSQIANIDGLFLVMACAVTTKDLPTCPGVYVLSCIDEVLYVGESTNLRARWAGHDYSGFVGIKGVNLHYIKCTDHKKVEKTFIRCLRPSFNGKRGSYPYIKQQSLKTGKSVADVKQALYDESPEDYKAALQALKAISHEMKASAV